MKEENEYLLISKKKSSQRTWTIVGFGLALLVVITAVVVSLMWSAKDNSNSSSSSFSSTNPSISSFSSTNPSISCPASNFPLGYHSFYDYDTIAKKETNQQPILIQNGLIWTGTGQVLGSHDILIVDGVIQQIGQNLPTNGAQVFNVEGRYVTPGLVDMHSHMGIAPFPDDSRASYDGNELTGPTQPYLRAMDCFVPEDRGIPLIRSGGTTTSLVLPGSQNVMGGESLTVKLKGKTVSNMLIPKAPRTLKMACGENVKNTYGPRNQTPSTRMGIGWKFRQLFFEAAQLKQQQEQWDCRNAISPAMDPRPQNLSLEPLVGVLNNKVLLNIHCYTVLDLEMIVRTSKEFNFSIAAFHHVLEGWKIPDVLRDNNIVAATFSDHWGFKFEGYDGSVKAPSILQNAGVKFALKSDHPVLYGKYLMLEAAKAVHYGLSEQDALATVTRVPANAIGLGDRIGTLEVGKDADVVVWDRYPFDIGATPNQVFIDGILMDNFNLPKISRNVLPQAQLSYTGTQTCSTSSYYILKGVTVYTMDPSNSIQYDVNIVVQNGTISCMSTTCSEGAATAIYTLNGGVVIPGIVSTGSQLGQLEIAQETGSWDGDVAVDNSASIRAVDGLRFHNLKNKQIKAAYSAGVHTIVTSPQGTSLVAGLGVAFYSRGSFADDAVINSNVSLNIHIGNKAKKGGFTNSISGQFAQLRNLFQANANVFPYSDVLNGKIPVVAHVHQSDQIASVLRFQKEIGFRLIILGGAEAHLLADRLAAANASVILSPAKMAPNGFELWEAVPNSAPILAQAGVSVALGIEEVGDTRNLIWEASYAYTQGLDYNLALASVTKTPAQMFGLYDSGVGSIQIGQLANFIAFSSDPFSIQSTVQFLAFGEQNQCNPQQF